MPLRFCAVLITLCLCPSLASAWTGRVISVQDGDTITVLHDGRPERVRLYGIDCPEKGQDFGRRAQHHVVLVCAGESVDVEPRGLDRYGRTVALVTVDGDSLQEDLLRAGLAWVFDRYCHEGFCPHWRELEREARTDRRGLWSRPDARPPWEWR